MLHAYEFVHDNSTNFVVIETCEITVKGNTTRRLVSATSLMTSDKEGLTDYDIEHLMNDTNGALWRVPGTNNFCRLYNS